MNLSTLGPYRLDRELGSGGMGKVYAAHVEGRVPGLEVGTVVALKVLHAHLLETPGFFKRFLREAEIGKSVVHGNVVRTFDCDSLTADGKRADFLVMEYVEGQTLRGLLGELGCVPEELCRHIGREVAKGLAAIHAAGVIHRDVKPENVLITRENEVKVMDLGVARLQDEAMRLSQTGAFVGSIHYAAPESFREGGKQVDGRADLHALGLVLYELASGVNPYFAETVPEILRKVLHEEPRRLGDVNPQLSPFYEEVVHCLLAKEPEDRFADATALVAVLSEGESSGWWTSRAKAIRAETRRPLRRIRIPRESAVYGREGELAKLRGLYEKAKAGEGQVVLLEGEAGIGKSRLVDELVGRLQHEGEDVNFLFGSYPPGGAATAAGAFSTAFREQFGADGSAPYLKPTPLLARAFDALLSGDATPAGVEALTTSSLQTCFVHALRGLAAERTTILLVDDLHFAPDEARSLFTALAMAVPGHRILLVGTTRPGTDEKWVAGLTRLPQTSQLVLHRLGPKDLVRLLSDTLRSESLATTLSAQIALKSDGNPFFVFEIVRGLREGQFITQQDDGSWVSTRAIGDIRIPASVRDLVNARVADLTEDERNLLDVAACWGFEFDPLLVGDVLGISQIPLMRALAHVEKKHRLVRSAGRRFAFDHHQVQEALYDAMPELLREPYHAALATVLEARTKAAETDPAALDGALCVDLCEHFLKGAQGGRALRYLAAADAYLTKSWLNGAAIRLAEQALAVPGLLTGADRARTLVRLSRPLNLLGRRKRLEEVVREADHLAEASGDLELRSHAKSLLGSHFLSRVGRSAEAEECQRAAVAIARAAGRRDQEAGFTLNLGALLFSLGRATEAREHLDRALAISREIGHRSVEVTAMGVLADILRAHGRFAEAAEMLTRTIAICREIGSRAIETAATGNLGGVLHVLGRLTEATGCYEQSLALCRETGYRENEAVALFNLGYMLREADDVAVCEERFVSCLAICEETGYAHLAAATHLALGELRARQARAEPARRSLETARDMARELGVAGVETHARCELALLPGGEPPDALSAFAGHEAQLGAVERIRARHLLWRATGDRTHLAEAKRLLEESVANVDAESRASMLANLRVNREVLSACRAEGIG